MEIPSTLCSNVYDFAFCPEPCYDRLPTSPILRTGVPATASSKLPVVFV